MKTTLARFAVVGATAATLTFGLLTGGVSAKTPDPLMINPHTLEVTAPADFTPGEGVAVWYNLADGTAVNFATTTAQADGSLDWTISATDYLAIPSDAVNLVAEGWQSDNMAIYTFDHAPVAPVALAINATTLEATAPANFLSGETIALWYNLPDGTAVNFGTAMAQADGSLDFTLDAGAYAAIPSNAVNFIAQGFESGHQAIFAFAH